MPLLIYLLSINIVSVFVCVYDKHQAKKQGWRVSEKFLFALCLLGGNVGMYLTMQKIRHKTKHKRFMIGIPIIILFQLAIGLFLLKNHLQ